MKKQPKTSIMIGLSGGVDSAVAAYLLKQQGYEVSALFMKNWEEDDADQHCTTHIDFTDAKAVCDRLSIPLHTVNFAQEYWDRVFTHFLEEYQAGRTPNPDILCNKEIKFKSFLQHAQALGAEKIATGHYVRSEHPDSTYSLLKGLDPQKDQSYFLYTLTQPQLAQTLFPLGGLTKPEVRRIAKQVGFINYEKKGSTGICFIGERKFKTFLSRYVLAQPGDIETPEGEVIGQHEGLLFFTLGQRQGLKIGGRRAAQAAPWYVVAKEVARNVLVVAQGDHPLLFSSTLLCTDTHWISGLAPTTPLRCSAKIRYRMADQACTVAPLSTTDYQVHFDTPQKAITPGQSIVFYQSAQCLGGGVIT